MRILKRYYWPFILLILFSSCQEVLDVDVTESVPQVVIKCQINNSPSSDFVIVSKTSNYYKATEYPFIDNALVILSDNFGRIDTLYNQNAYGEYSIHVNRFWPIAKTYSLEVQANGKSYKATSTMPNLVKIDSLGYTYYPDQDPIHGKGYYPIAYFTDPPNENNYYLWKFYKNTGFSSSDGVYISKDQNIKGFIFPLSYQSKERAKVELYCITKEAYDFYYGVQQQLRNDGGFFSSPPANAPSNFSNGALGLFQTARLDTLSILLP